MKKAHLAMLALVLLPVLYGLWRVDVIPGIWDLQHWGQDVGAVAQAERAAHRLERLEQFEADAPLPGRVVFLGSSTLERMPLADLFPGAATLNRGIGDEPAGQLLERLGPSLAAAPDPAGFVVYVASVDLRRLGVSPEVLVRRATRVLDELSRRAPGVPVLLLGLLPERDLGASRRAVLEQANAGLAALAARPGRPDVTFLPTDRAPLQGPGGRLPEELSVDHLHLNAAGYQVLAGWIRLEGGPLADLLFP